MKENQTIRFLMRFLEENTTLQLVDCGSWFYAVKRGQTDEDRIAFRADMDALPIYEDERLPYHSINTGVSHKCGHDGHCAVLCGLALELEDKEPDRSVYLIFQPGEEIGQGAICCSKLIRQENISEIYAFHNLGGYPENSIVYRPGLTQPASEGLRIRLSGKTCHASTPEEGRNPAKIIAKIILYADELCELIQGEDQRMVLCTVTGVHLGSDDFGISPGDGELLLTIRSEKESDLKMLEEKILSYTHDLGVETGIQVDHSVHDYFPETRNHPDSLACVMQAADDLRFERIAMDHLWRASEDFGWYLKECPGAMFYVGNGIDHPALHTQEYDFNDNIIETAVDMFLYLTGIDNHR